MMNNNNEYSYVKDFAPLQGKNVTLTSKAELYCINKKEIEANKKVRLNEIHAGYSRFELTIIDKNSDLKTASYNIKAGSEFRALQKEISSAAEMCRQYKYTSSNIVEMNTNTPNTPAYNWKFKAGNLKGKSPAQVLSEEGDAGKKTLEGQYNWLKENAKGKFEAANKEGMNAILEACNLYNGGQLVAVETAAKENCFEVYYDPVKMPKASKTQDGDYTPQASIRITCEPGKQYPFNVTIENCEVKLKKYPDGRVVSITRDEKGEDIRKNIVTCSFNARYADLEALFDKMLARMEDFESMCYPAIMKEAEKLSYKPVSESAS